MNEKGGVRAHQSHVDIPRGPEHISVCICTYQRPSMLLELLRKLEEQETSGFFTYSVVVVDNDAARSAEATVSGFLRGSDLEVMYVSEPRRNIALARNAAVSSANGDYVALIDDDELPGSSWLLTLYRACSDHEIDGVLGPVRASYAVSAPDWVLKGRFYDKGWHQSGDKIGWKDARTSNVLMKSRVFEDGDNLFRLQFGRGGEDVDFFQRAIQKKYVFVWCAEATVWETIPVARLTRRYILRRALLRGQQTVRYDSFGWELIFKSLLAVPLYLAILPIALVAGHHRFMQVAMKLCEHSGRLLAVLGVNVIKEYYVTG